MLFLFLGYIAYVITFLISILNLASPTILFTRMKKLVTSGYRHFVISYSARFIEAALYGFDLSNVDYLLLAEIRYRHKMILCPLYWCESCRFRNLG